MMAGGQFLFISYNKQVLFIKAETGSLRNMVGPLSTESRPPIPRFWLMSFCIDPEKRHLGDVSQISEFQKRVAFGPLLCPRTNLRLGFHQLTVRERALVLNRENVGSSLDKPPKSFQQQAP